MYVQPIVFLLRRAAPLVVALGSSACVVTGEIAVDDRQQPAPGTTTGEGTGTGEGSSGGETTGGSGSTTGSSSTGGSTTGDACPACVEEACSKVLFNCQAEPSCACGLDCLYAGGLPAECADGCGGDTSLLEVLDTCMAEHCAAICP